MALSWDILDLCSLYAFFMQQLSRKIFRNILEVGLGLSFCPFLIQQPLHKSHPAQHFPAVFALLPLQPGAKPMHWSWWIQTFFLETFLVGTFSGCLCMCVPHCYSSSSWALCMCCGLGYLLDPSGTRGCPMQATEPDHSSSCPQRSQASQECLLGFGCFLNKCLNYATVSTQTIRKWFGSCS